MAGDNRARGADSDAVTAREIVPVSTIAPSIVLLPLTRISVEAVMRPALLILPLKVGIVIPEPTVMPPEIEPKLVMPPVKVEIVM